ncbi:hypothetical protein AB0M43_36315 [Longispora sp. NPDC051575]|uniref:hypothetical protein n=1 Tax=Longispora sp. NPDC051575 TaxID=3154943 RepID=UPI0034343675
MTGHDGGPRHLSDPVAVIIEIVARVEPGLDPSIIGEAVGEVASTRTGRRGLAQALEGSPGLLVSGRTDGPPLVDRLIRLLREHGAVNVAQPCCGSCGRPARRMTTRDEWGLRICGSCDSRAKGLFAPRPCAVCGRVLVPRAYDRQGLARCELCPPDPGVDHLEVICDHVAAVNARADRTLLRELIASTIRQAAQRRQVAWSLQDRPDLLTGAAWEGSPAVRRLVKSLTDQGVEGVVPVCCPSCGKARQLVSYLEGKPCCGTCSQRARAALCVRCGQLKQVTARNADGGAVCAGCWREEAFNKAECSGCGVFSAIVSHRDGAMLCRRCERPPVAICSTCGELKPCHSASTPAPQCGNCSRQARVAQCGRCGNLRPIGGRDSEGQPLCGWCAARREPCCRCGRTRPVNGRIGDGALCWTCIKTEPAFYRACGVCGDIARLHRDGRCERCAAPTVLDAALTGSGGTVRRELEPIRDALATSHPATLLNWLHRPSTRALLDQLARADGPVTHQTIDQLSPAGPARHLRQVLIAQGVLPARDRQLNLLERWLADTLAQVDDADEQRLLRSYLAWTHLRRLRNATGPTTPFMAASIRDEVKSVLKLLGWLRGRGQDLRGCTQADLDDWCMQAGRMPRRARQFIAWCGKNGHTRQLAIAPPRPSASPTAFDDEDTRWQLARRLLHDDAITTPDRTAGLLVLLYGQTVSRIVGLTTDHVTQADGQVRLRLGPTPMTIPGPLDHMLLRLAATRRGKAALGHTDNHPWLFPGGLPGQPIHPLAMGNRLRALGIPARIARNTALMENAATLPAKVISDLLGLSVSGAVRWTKIAGASADEYAAEVTRRDPTAR